MTEFKSMGKDVIIYPKTKIICPEEVSIGNNVIIDDFSFLFGKGGITIGDFVHMASFCIVTGGNGLVIGDFGSISGGVYFYTNNENYSGEWMTNPTVPAKYRGAKGGPIHLEKHVIIGTHCTILPNVHVGEGVAIGAHSLVIEDCKPWLIYAGVPAKPINLRRSDRIPELEKQLRMEFYDQHGKYIPKGLI